MLKGIIFVTAYYTIGFLLSALAYQTYGHPYVHAPGLYHLILFLTFAGGVLLMIVALVKHFRVSTSPKLKGIILSNAVALLVQVIAVAYVIAEENTKGMDLPRNEISVSRNGDTTILYHAGNILFMKVKDSVLLNFIDSARLSQILDSAGITLNPSGLTVSGTPQSTDSDHASYFEKLSELPDDSTVYIGEIDSFDQSGEFYTPVFYHRDVDPSAYHERVSESADSVIFEDDEMKRSRLPHEIARRVFNLSGLQRISIYHQGRYLTDAKFVGVDLIEGMIESQFVAVFKPASMSDRFLNGAYCVSSDRQHHFESVKANSTNIEDESLTANICKILAIDNQRVQHAVHVKMDDDKIYSAISLHQGAFVVETNGSESQILKEIKEDYYLIDILPIHLAMNGKPMLLIQMGVNETDMVWTSLAIFTGAKYEFAERNRVRR